MAAVAKVALSAGSNMIECGLDRRIAVHLRNGVQCDAA
jgi:hypothetical protein